MSNNKRSFIPEGDIEGINELSIQEYCKDELDVLTSETAVRILFIIIKKLNRGRKGVEQEKNNDIMSLWELFSTGSPLTDKGRNQLISFFMSAESINLGNEILSRISIQQSDSNKKFIREFLEYQDASKRYTSINFVNSVLENLENYPIIVDIEIYNDEGYTEYDVIEGLGTYYSYRDKNGGYKLFLLKENLDVVYFDEYFFEDLKIFKNGTVFGVQEKLVSNNGADEEIDNPNSVSTVSKIGNLYKFDGRKLVKVYEKEGIVGIERVDEKEGLLVTVNSSGKKGVIKSDDAFKVSTILNELFDGVHSANGFIITYDNYVGDDNIHYRTVGVHKVSFDDYGNEIGETILGVTSYGEYFPGFIPVRFYDEYGVCIISTTKGSNFYKIDENNNTLVQIDGLQGVLLEVGNLDRFLEGFPVVVNYKGVNYVKVYDKVKKDCKILAGGSNCILSVEGDRITIGGDFHLWYHGGKLYKLDESKYYMNGDGLVRERGFVNRLPFVFNLVSLVAYEYESMKSYLVDVNSL